MIEDTHKYLVGLFNSEAVNYFPLVVALQWGYTCQASFFLNDGWVAQILWKCIYPFHWVLGIFNNSEYHYLLLITHSIGLHHFTVARIWESQFDQEKQQKTTISYAWAEPLYNMHTVWNLGIFAWIRVAYLYSIRVEYDFDRLSAGINE